MKTKPIVKPIYFNNQAFLCSYLERVAYHVLVTVLISHYLRTNFTGSWTLGICVKLQSDVGLSVTLLATL